MSTRGAIARITDINAGTFAGRYHHWDSYPEGLGQALFNARREFFDGNTERMLRFLIDEHPAGWSTIVATDLTRQPGFHEGLGYDDLPCVICGEDGPPHLCQTYGYDAHITTVYGQRGEDVRSVKYPCATDYAHHRGHWFDPDPALVADRRLDPQCYCHGDRREEEWLVTEKDASGSGVEYVYAFKDNRMLVLSSYVGDEKMIGMFGMGDPDALWKPILEVDLDGPEPDWRAWIEDAA